MSLTYVDEHNMWIQRINKEILASNNFLYF